MAKSELGILARKLAGTPVAIRNPDGPSSWGFLTGMVRRRMESMSWKIAVLAPIPRARVRTGDESETGAEAKKTAKHGEGRARTRS